MTFNLWDTATSNSFGQYEDEREVLELVRTLVDYYGEDYADDLGLGRVTDEGEIVEPLSGAALIARLNEVFPERQGTGDRRGAVITSSG